MSAAAAGEIVRLNFKLAAAIKNTTNSAASVENCRRSFARTSWAAQKHFSKIRPQAEPAYKKQVLITTF
ncbi:MAG: hypothetical protein MR878_02575 [Campylobacter sp.]|uniref:hypothetical protein n=1 Tax=Campylobacter sp. TaxID=205 RepID=UPI002AA5F495|nr:hypothetical protein [Campylobacter sp.]MCI7014258.1 hypothetical protein [Campylobacter sp.]